MSHKHDLSCISETSPGGALYCKVTQAGLSVGEEARTHQSVSTVAPRTLKCEMESDCRSPVTYVDTKGYVYCTPHGLQRKDYQRCRKLRPNEIEKLKRGETIRY
jgi:hypothetical protein